MLLARLQFDTSSGERHFALTAEDFELQTSLSMLVSNSHPKRQYVRAIDPNFQSLLERGLTIAQDRAMEKHALER